MSDPTDSGWITIVGAREHNLRDVTVRIPRGRLTVITGLSGSGKSSLAFDTLFAEGQRRYVESLSAYARQFLDQMQKPDVDRIDGLSPAIAIEQRTAGSNPRSIVATTTEVYDFLRVLFAAVGVPHCPACGRRVSRQTADQIVDALMAHPPRTRVMLLAPLARGRGLDPAEALEQARRQGFVRARVDGELCELDSPPRAGKGGARAVDLVVDRLVVTSLIRPRMTDSVELALRHGNGTMIAAWEGADGAWAEAAFSERQSCPDCGVAFDVLTARHFSFNSPYGACPSCAGLGTKLVLDEDLVVPDPSLSIEEGALRPWKRGGRRLVIYYNRLLRALAAHYGFSAQTPFADLPRDIRRTILRGSGEERVKFGFWRNRAYRAVEKPFEGVIPNLERRYAETESEAVRQRLREYMTRRECPDCRGARLRPEVLACTLRERSIMDVARMSVRQAFDFFTALEPTEQERKIAGDVLAEVRARLGFMANVGLDYLTLDRESGSLSGGEAQRIRLATQIGSNLVGVLYVLDEPSIGLHQRDNARLLETLKRLRDAGNTVVVVEHDEDTIRTADYVVDLGPGAGSQGGRVVFQGPAPALGACGASLTAKYLNGELEIPVPATRKAPDQEWLRVEGASENNLRDIDVAIPLGLLVCVTGVSGSGKSTLVDEVLRKALCRRLHGARERPGRHRRLVNADKLDKVIVIDQSPIGRTPRSNPATYTGIFTAIRDLFSALPASKVRGYGPGRYSFNVKGGRCEACRGDGVIRLEMHFLPDVYVTCEKCRGARYNSETLEIRFGGRNIAEVLAMTVDEALEFFRNVPALERRLRTLSEVGLSYVQLGQSATTLSGGEAQRLKLSAELSRQSTGRTLYLLDEPTTGLHFADVQRLLDVLGRLRDAGNTLVVVEHNPHVIKTADYIIDLGPEGGEGGGRVVAAGTPEEVARCAESHTGEVLRRALGRSTATAEPSSPSATP